MTKKLVGEKIDWDQIAQSLEAGFNSAVKLGNEERWDVNKVPHFVKAAEIATALARVSAEQRAAVKDQREREREQPSFTKPRN